MPEAAWGRLVRARPGATDGASASTTRELTLTPTQVARLRALPVPTRALPTPQERDRLRQLCSNRLNWSDGGYWIGPGSPPNCFHTTQMAGTHEIVFDFHTDASAFRWNSEWERAIRYLGHFGTAVLTTILARFDGRAAIVVGTLAAVLKDELQAAISYPRVARNWRYVLSFHYSLAWGAHPWSKSIFFQEASGGA